MAVTAKPDTGHGATLTFGTTSWSGKIRGIPTNLQLTRPRVNVSHLATSGEQEYVCGDLNDHGELTFDVLFEQYTGLPATTGTPETITVTFPLNPNGGGAVAAKIAGTGYITGITYPPLQTNQEMIGQITISYDGGTGPTWTAEA